jgi:hypothetical protein
VVLAQWPNAALCVWIAALLLTWTGQLASHSAALSGVGRGALIVWALDEMVRRVNPFRRLLGAVVLLTAAPGEDHGVIPVEDVAGA